MSCFAERAIRELDPKLYQRFEPRPARHTRPMLELCREALAQPIGQRPLAELSREARRIVVVVSDASRDEPRAELVTSLLEVLPKERVRLIVASGTHAPGDTSVVPSIAAGLPVVVHDADRDEDLVDLGATREGTPVRLHRWLVEADLVVVTGRIRPHYFAGFSGGTKGVFPGCACRAGALQNHLLKADPTARLGRVDDNRCRLDMEEAAGKLPGRLSILNTLADCDGRAVAAVAGHPIAAHRALIGRARELFQVRAPRSPVVIVADRPPVSRSLYQASKLLPPAGALLEPGGALILVAECDQGAGPRERVNEGIYRLGIVPQLPRDHRVLLVSQLNAEQVAQSYASAAPSLEVATRDELARCGAERAVLLYRAGETIAVAV